MHIRHCRIAVAYLAGRSLTRLSPMEPRAYCDWYRRPDRRAGRHDPSRGDSQTV